MVVPGDGNCLFHAISVAVCGKTSLSTELRVRCCIEMVANKNELMEMNKRMKIGDVSPEYDEAVKDCAINGRYSSAWTIAAAAVVLGRNITSVYPPKNGLIDKSFSTLNTVFSPPNQNPRPSASISIMWSSCSLPAPDRIWIPNHFVPLLLNTPPVTVDLRSPHKATYADVTRSSPKKGSRGTSFTH